MRRAIIWVAVVGAIGCSPLETRDYVARSPATKTDAAFVRRFLRSWLVERDLSRTEQFLHPRFRLVNASDPTWPERLKAMPERERAVRFAWECYGAPLECADVSSCIEPVEKSRIGAETFDLELVEVDEDMLSANQYLRPFKGKTLMQCSFILRGCNIGASMLLEPEGSSDARVISVFYIAG